MRDAFRRPSLRTRLFALLIGTTLLAWAAAIGFVYFDTREEVGELLDAHLAQSAAMLLARSETELSVTTAEHAPQLHRYARKVVFQVWQQGSILRLHSANAPAGRLSVRGEGYDDAQVDGRRWRVFSAWTQGHRYLIQVAERQSTRAEISEAVVENLLLPMLMTLPVLALAIWLSVSRALAPLRAVSDTLQRRDPQQLDPVEATDAPREIAPLVSNLNRLFGRITAMMERERRFTADAAHELRTPLAALRAQAQVARSSDDDGVRVNALDHVIDGCDRASRLVEQMLTLARLDPGRPLLQPERIDLGAVTAETIALVAPAAIEMDVDLGLDRTGTPMVDGDGALLGILVRNLVDNAVRYSASGSRVDVQVEGGDDAVHLRVRDHGAGIPASERERVWERFHRVPGTGAAGSGLGLSIVRGIAELHGARASLETPVDGTGLVVCFPAARSPVADAPKRSVPH